MFVPNHRHLPKTESRKNIRSLVVGWVGTGYHVYHQQTETLSTALSCESRSVKSAGQEVQAPEISSAWQKLGEFVGPKIDFKWLAEIRLKLVCEGAYGTGLLLRLVDVVPGPAFLLGLSYFVFGRRCRMSGKLYMTALSFDDPTFPTSSQSHTFGEVPNGKPSVLRLEIGRESVCAHVNQLGFVL